MPMMQQFPMRLDASDAALLAAVAKQTGRSRADVMRAALRLFYSQGAGEWRFLTAELLAPEDIPTATRRGNGKGGA